jgi:L-ribulose-5-phosphate 3-epimerase
MRSTRREALRAATGLGALALSSPLARLAGAGEDDGPWFRISLAQWSNHRALGRDGRDNLEWISSVRGKYEVEAVEFVNQFFADKARDWDYLAEMKRRAADAGVRMLLIMIDGEGALAAEDAAAREAAVENHRKWVVAASYLGCHSIRVNAAGSGDPGEMQKRAAESLVRLADFGAPYGVSVIVENHGGWSSNGEWLAGVMKLAGHEGVGTLPDFGNFRLGGGAEYDRYKGVEELMPFAKAVSAKSHAFGPDGGETSTDYLRMMRIVKDSGYRGFVGIEYEGGGHSEDEGIRLTRDLLRRVRAELA